MILRRLTTLSGALALLGNLALPSLAGASGSGNGAVVTRTDVCNESGVCLEQRQVFHHVETPSGNERTSTNGAFTITIASGDVVTETSTRHHLQVMTRDGETHELRERQRYTQSSGESSCEIGIARHEANGSVQYDSQTTCEPT